MTLEFKQVSLTACVVGMIVGTACGRQVDTEYLGEPLLSLRGQVLSSSLTTNGEPQATPALCFRHLSYHDGFVVNKEIIPADIREKFGDLSRPAGRDIDMNIVDVESRGDFPAEFAVDVFVPPDPQVVRPLRTGEPLSALGTICAVTPEHPDFVQQFDNSGYSECPEEGGCNGANIRMTADGSRFYIERFTCPEGAAGPSECAVTREGDASLRRESGGWESIVAINSDIQILYLAEPAPKGSYTAYRAGSIEGLPAGYHVRTSTSEGGYFPFNCLRGVFEKSLAELNETLGTSYETISAIENREHLTTYDDIAARHEMQSCPLLRETTALSSDDALTIKLDPKDEFPQPFPLPNHQE
jgi:hypothetical protein